MTIRDGITFLEQLQNIHDEKEPELWPSFLEMFEEENFEHGEFRDELETS